MILRLWLILQTAWASMVTRWSNKPPLKTSKTDCEQMEEAIAKGAYGSPTMIVNEGQLYFGNDQLPLVRQALLAG